MQLCISLPSDNATLSVSQLKTIVDANIPLLEDSLIGNLSYYSDNARYEAGSLTVTGLEPLSAHVYSMTYRYRWTIFNGCLDIDAAEQREERITFTHSGSQLCFNIIDNSRPSPSDEL
ncbi:MULTISPECIES: hypothetical protein [Yersiniaceae]|uniref:Uncharacterized protein n=1 Tax=Nissabacter archeti TaxID=1917880 RepID=A0ABS5JEA9_9GAMM|nr:MULTISPECIES: hypothetical protein [Yersiniaceae]MBS0968289.1 hypothetical protein [Nissabacter archeti]MDV5139487.1 hypothetical protein [Chimaeribacter arupi]WKZ91500.1 hypothetical protein P0E69_14980 [Chimaeribacter arupi]